MNKFGALFAVATGLSLSGCQSFPLFHLASGGHVNSAARPDVAVDHYTQLGRQELDAGQTGAAIDSFRVALAVGEDPAAALNGLGVAYTRLDRMDAAEELFARASQLEPANGRYAHNLALVEARKSASALASAKAAPRADLAAATPEERPGELVRVSSWQVKIRTADVATSSSAALPQVASRSAGKFAARPDTHSGSGPVPVQGLDVGAKPLALVDPRFKPLIRIAFGNTTKDKSAVVHQMGAQTEGDEATVASGFVPALRMEFADVRRANGQKSKVVVVAER